LGEKSGQDINENKGSGRLSYPSTVFMAQTVSEALEVLSDQDAGAVIVAGATWVMRAQVRHAPIPRMFVALSNIPELGFIEINRLEISIGSLVTHDILSKALLNLTALRALRQAAACSANPGVRQIATIGGNVCAEDFAAADLVAAALCLDATVELHRTNGTQTVALADYLELRTRRRAAEILTRIIIPMSDKCSAHARLTMRKAGDYPVVIVSVSAARCSDNTLRDVRIAVGSVEATARRWTSLESALEGQLLDPATIQLLAATHIADFTPREAAGAPGWYRIQVLPYVLHSACVDLRGQLEGNVA
jgi:carbon-monoxide dehydrogenase medium subunit